MNFLNIQEKQEEIPKHDWKSEYSQFLDAEEYKDFLEFLENHYFNNTKEFQACINKFNQWLDSDSDSDSETDNYYKEHGHPAK